MAASEPAKLQGLIREKVGLGESIAAGVVGIAEVAEAHADEPVALCVVELYPGAECKGDSGQLVTGRGRDRGREAASENGEFPRF